MVARPPVSLERQDHRDGKTVDSGGVGRLNLRLGSNLRRGGPWSPEERQWHINCLEAIAAFHAVKCFVRDKRGVSVLLRLDNTSAVCYVDKLGGTVSPRLNAIVKELWLWCMVRDITLTAAPTGRPEDSLAEPDAHARA